MIEKIADLDAYLLENDNSINNSYFSEVSNACKQFPCMLGIDEAGRGPVLGPMVYGTAFCPINEGTLPDKLGCADSKELTEKKREEIFELICQTNKFGWGVEVIAPNSICNNMFSRQKHSLNQVSMDSAIGLIKKAMELGVKISHVYVDTVGPPEKYQAYLKSLFPKFDITVAKKADSTYPIVSAASICAKVTRDRALKLWKFKEDLELSSGEFGSGYPADPETKKFLQNNYDPVFGYPQLVRFSWSTTKDALDKAYFVEYEEVESNENQPPIPANNTTITSFFKMTSKTLNHKKKEHEFFSTRGLCRNVEF